MKLIDMLRMSGSSLWKRKLRTILTVLGVVIGVASIVVMVSLGLGLRRTEMEQIESYGSMTTIQVQEKDGSSYAVSAETTASSSSSEKKEEKRLDDELVEELKLLPNVETVSPILNISCIVKYGNYISNLSVQGMSEEALKALNIELGEGTLPKEGEELKFVYGNQILTYFSNASSGKSYWDTGELPAIDLMKNPMFVIFDTEAYYNSQGSSGATPGTTAPSVAQPKKYLIPASGVIVGTLEDYNQYSWSVFCNMDALVSQLKRTFKNKAIPGQPTTKSGKPYKKIFYNEIRVNVDSIDNVSTVQTMIADMGYQTYTDAEWIQSEQTTLGYMQAVLGGIGAVSLLVAAIGIANTMMMSIYERTKEIGVMKVLGCDMNNIRTMFLLEAGYIGFLGGIVGIALSYLVSFIINKAVSSLGEYYTQISYIPFWLVGVSLGFAVLVGMLAGLFPALRAMKLSPLTAIRNE
ncbi:MAG: ABC transporter permease [Lachnospiraceae bacterium]|nr:ABC transporter permease [Lachnospiraceae bacterium]